jgi:hypothetical protein
MKTLRRRLARLEALRPVPAADERLREQRWQAICERWEALLNAAEPLLSEDEWRSVHEAIEQLCNEDRGPYAHWLRDLEHGWSRLPEMSAAAMKELLLAWLSPAANSGIVCNRCGLERPYCMGLPPPRPGAPPGEEYFSWREFEVPCPGCGNADHDFNWAHLTERRYYAWKELDGYMGGGGAA